MLQNPLLTYKSELKSNALGQQVYNLLDQTFQIPNDFQYNVIEVTEGFIGRMDLISKQVYGDTKYQDVLCKLNGISNPFELNAGTVVVLPDVSYIDDFYYYESPEERDPESNEAANKPVAKSKKEKRKPNEAVIGEKRFKIDPNRKVIVY